MVECRAQKVNEKQLSTVSHLKKFHNISLYLDSQAGQKSTPNDQDTARHLWQGLSGPADWAGKI